MVERQPLKFQARELINFDDRSRGGSSGVFFFFSLPWMTRLSLKCELQKLKKDIYGEKMTSLGLGFINYNLMRSGAQRNKGAVESHGHTCER